jgi:hypothetical protein
VALTRRCKGANDGLSTCAGKAAGTAVRVYSDVNTLTAALGISAATAMGDIAGLYQGVLLSPNHSIRADFDGLVLCNTAGW